jgi:NYN domain-containing protein
MVLSDLTTLARGRLISDAVLVTGDGDFVEAVAAAQRDGVRVHVWGARTPQGTVSPDLRREADRFRMLEPGDLEPFFARVPLAEAALPGPLAVSTELSGRPSRLGGSVPVAGSVAVSGPVWASIDPEDARVSGTHFARQWAGQVSPGQIASMLASRPQVQGDVHFKLLRFTLEAAHLPWGTRLPYETTEAMRNGFWEALTEIAQGMSAATEHRDDPADFGSSQSE